MRKTKDKQRDQSGYQYRDNSGDACLLDLAIGAVEILNELVMPQMGRAIHDIGRPQCLGHSFADGLTNPILHILLIHAAPASSSARTASGESANRLAACLSTAKARASVASMATSSGRSACNRT